MAADVFGALQEDAASVENKVRCVCVCVCVLCVFFVCVREMLLAGRLVTRWAPSLQRPARSQHTL